VMFYRIALCILLAVVLPANGICIQIDFTGSDRIDGQSWQIEFTILNINSEDSFYVRLPYPNYTMNGRWSVYSTQKINVDVVGECGPVYYEEYIYNIGYSNEGVWIKVKYPCYRTRIYLYVKQNARFNLPGIDYPLYHYTNNGWMDGTWIVDVYSCEVAEALGEALDLDCEFHDAGFWHEPEQITNWMMMNIDWSEYDGLIPASQVLTQGYGDCDEWAHTACALLLKAGIPAKVVLCGAIPVQSAVGFTIDYSGMHLSVAYWDGFGWILMDPNFGSGFGVLTRVVLGADRDITGVKIEFYPKYLENFLQDLDYTPESGIEISYLYNAYPYRCLDLPQWNIIEHYQLPESTQSSYGIEPQNNIIPNVVTYAEGVTTTISELSLINYPNPFNPSTVFKFYLDTDCYVKLELFTVEGKKVGDIASCYMTAGEKSIFWTASNVTSGIYFVRLLAGSKCTVKKVIVLR